MRNSSGMTRLRVAIFIGVVLIVSLISIFSIDYYKDTMRDAVRLADMSVIQSAMNRLYGQNASYALSDGCGIGSLLSDNGCFDQLKELVGAREFLSDPKEKNLLCVAEHCGVRSCNYTVGQKFDSMGYKVYFHLERGFASLIAGCHYLDQTGIH